MPTDTTHVLSTPWNTAAEHGEAQRRAFLDGAAPVLAGPRRASLSALRIGGGESVLDAGCGTGIAAVELAELVGADGGVVGVDGDPAMVAATARRAGAGNVDARLGDIRALDFPDATFDAARVERVLLHLTCPQADAAVAELVRVTRPGGRVAVLEPDMAQMSVDAGAAVHDVRSAALAQICNPRAGVRARAALLDAGCVDVTVEIHPVVLTRLEDFRRIAFMDQAVDGLLAAGLLLPALVDEARADLAARDAAGRFLSVHVLYVVAATAPTGPQR